MIHAIVALFLERTQKIVKPLQEHKLDPSRQKTEAFGHCRCINLRQKRLGRAGGRDRGNQQFQSVNATCQTTVAQAAELEVRCNVGGGLRGFQVSYLPRCPAGARGSHALKLLRHGKSLGVIFRAGTRGCHAACCCDPSRAGQCDMPAEAEVVP